jgi:hypothetical protein
MYLIKNRSDAALYVWDYFYLSAMPAAGDEKAWGWIERATFRIRESEPLLDEPIPVDVRRRNARRVRNAARVALRHIAVLSVLPPSWTIDWLEKLEALATHIMLALSESAGRMVVH